MTARDEGRKLQRKAFSFLPLQIGTEVNITNGTRCSSQAQARLSGESEPSKVNRGGPDCLRMCTVSQTTDTEDLEVEVQVSLMVAAVAALTIGGLFTCSSHGLCHRRSVYYAAASAWKRRERSLTHGPVDIGNRPGKGAAGWNPTWDIPHARPPSVPHGREFMFTSTRDPLCADLPRPRQGHVPTRTTMRGTFHQVATQAIQTADNNLLSVLRRISLPKSMITL